MRTGAASVLLTIPGAVLFTAGDRPISAPSVSTDELNVSLHDMCHGVILPPVSFHTPCNWCQQASLPQNDSYHTREKRTSRLVWPVSLRGVLSRSVGSPVEVRKKQEVQGQIQERERVVEEC